MAGERRRLQTASSLKSRGAGSSQGQSAACSDVGPPSTAVTSPSPTGRPLFSSQLAVHAAREHLDWRALLRIGKIEADGFGRLAHGRVVELEDRMPGRLEEAVAGFEQLNRLALQLKMKASGRYHPHSRDRMTMRSRRLPRRKFDAGAFDQANGWLAEGSSSSRSGSRFKGGKCVSATAIVSTLELGSPRHFRKGACSARSACPRRSFAVQD